MKTETKLMIYLIFLALIDTIIPVPFTAILLLYVLVEKPGWFEELYKKVYDR
jgi:hypothetical protein